MNTSWEEVAEWYDKIVGKSGHYFHEEIIFPNLLKLIRFDQHSKILDLGSGTGVFANQLPKGTAYQGIDASPEMVRKAGRSLVHDLTQPLDLKEKNFTHAFFILSLQNMKDPRQALENATKHLSSTGTLYLVLNHPYFRIPRQSSWGIDQEKKIQYRRLDRYLSPLEIPIDMQPGTGKVGAKTFSYHFPLSTYINILGDLGFGVAHMEEWTSEKVSTGKFAKMENRARNEFPLFLLLVAKSFAKDVSTK